MYIYRFEGEVENKSLISTFLSMLDGQHIKLSGFPALLKVLVFIVLAKAFDRKNNHRHGYQFMS